jgi:hypothetical protein
VISFPDNSSRIIPLNELPQIIAALIGEIPEDERRDCHCW